MICTENKQSTWTSLGMLFCKSSHGLVVVCQGSKVNSLVTFILAVAPRILAPRRQHYRLSVTSVPELFATVPQRRHFPQELVMGTEGPARFPRASLMYISPGNILNYHNLKKTIPKTSTDELKLALNNALANTPSISPTQDRITDTMNEEVMFSVPGPRIELSGSSSPDGVKITVKLMLSNAELGITSQAVAMAIKELGVSKVDGILLSMPARPFDEELTIDHYKPVWLELEELVKRDKIKTLGVCDLDLAMLKKLHSWAHVKPTTNQMNQASCCVIPPALKEFANENMIQLISHSDSSDILPPDVFQEVLRTHYPEVSDSASWHPSWVLRYTALIKNRGIITTKGYIVRAQRVLPLG